MIFVRNDDPRRAVSSYSFSRTRDKDLNGSMNRGNLSSSRQHMYRSYMENSPDKAESILISQKLEEYNRKLQETNERRDRSLQNRIRPIKEHLSKIDKALENVNSYSKEREFKSVIQYTQKDKKITETRKRRKKFNLRQRNIQAVSFSEGKSFTYLMF